MTAYSVRRPDGEWLLLLVNKDQFALHSLTVSFHDSADNSGHYFQGKATQVSFSSGNYVWHPADRMAMRTLTAQQ